MCNKCNTASIKEAHPLLNPMANQSCGSWSSINSYHWSPHYVHTVWPKPQICRPLTFFIWTEPQIAWLYLDMLSKAWKEYHWCYENIKSVPSMHNKKCSYKHMFFFRLDCILFFCLFCILMCLSAVFCVLNM